MKKKKITERFKKKAIEGHMMFLTTSHFVLYFSFLTYCASSNIR